MAKDLTEALRSLTEASGQTSRVDKALPARPNPPAIPARSGSAGPVATPGAGIASPLTEGDFSNREFHASGWKSTDGLITLPAIKKVIMTDAVGSVVVFNFAAPP